MAQPDLPIRKFNLIDAGRMAIVIVLLLGFIAVWCFVLPWIQAPILPTMPGGDAGPWLIREIFALRICAAAILAVVTLMLSLRFLRRRWNAQDARMGSCFNPYRNRPYGVAGVLIAGSALAVIYAAALVFFLFSWTIVDQAGIKQRLPWGNRNHSFDQIKLLEKVPRELRRGDESMPGDGPWYRIEFTDGRQFVFGQDNEDCSEAEAANIAKYIAEKSHKGWIERGKR